MTERRSRHAAAWVVPVATAAVLVGVALVQGLVIQEVGIPGVVSVKLGERSGGAREAAPGTDVTPTPSAGAPGPVPTSAPAEADRPGPSEPVGSWSGSLGEVTVEVTRVEDADGHLRVEALVTNGTRDTLTIPLLGGVTAHDEAGRAYLPDPWASDWVDTVAAGETVAGTVQFDGRYESGPGRLAVLVGSLYGPDVPNGSIVVSGIPRP